MTQWGPDAQHKTDTKSDSYQGRQLSHSKVNLAARSIYILFLRVLSSSPILNPVSIWRRCLLILPVRLPFSAEDVPDAPKILFSGLVDDRDRGRRGVCPRWR